MTLEMIWNEDSGELGAEIRWIGDEDCRAQGLG